MIIWGIDIGIHGALTMFDVSNSVLEIHDMPAGKNNDQK